MSSQNWYSKTSDETLRDHRTTFEQGLSFDQVNDRQQLHGQNRIEGKQKRGAWRILLSQFTDFLILILLAAALLSAFLGDPQDTVVIAAIIILNSCLGFIQEYRAEKAMEALQSLASPRALVRRMGKTLTVPAFDLVPGDIVLLESGNIIPADLRLIEAVQLTVDESTLTGESMPVEKKAEGTLPDALPLGDQNNMAFKGTHVRKGRAVGVVTQIGMNTELGRIAHLLQEEVEVKTPLQNRLNVFAKWLSLIILLFCLFIFFIGLWRGEPPLLMFLTALSMAVAAIPEALPAVVTISLAIGARRMTNRQALVRKLPAVEALGSVTWICTDKTGTLTENRMRTESFYLDGKFSTRLFFPDAEDSEPSLFLQILALSHDAKIADNKLIGDPTETALLESALATGLDYEELLQQLPRVAEIPFSSERGLMTTIHKSSKGHLVFCKGAPEKIFPLCRSRWSSQGEVSLDQKIMQSTVEKMAQQGMRVLAFAHKNSGPSCDLALAEKELCLIGLVGLMDPPRPEAIEAVRNCQAAGIRVVMITGDHPSTAQAIAKKIGISSGSPDELITGSELSRLGEKDILQRIRQWRVCARVAPDQKIQIVKALQACQEVTAMTGDGVNDAPALRRADVGVAMGKNGTDVAREAAHIILLDDNFSTLAAAIHEGRRIYDNIRKFIRFALTGNLGEILVLFLAPFLNFPTPLLPIHILWVNLLTDGLPGLALASEPAEKNLMNRPPRAKNESVFADGLWQHILWVGFLISALTLGGLAWGLSQDSRHWQSMAFTILTFTQMGHILAIRSEFQSFFQLGFFSNKPLLAAVAVTVALQLIILYVPVCQDIFKTTPLTFQELLQCLFLSSLVFFAVEMEKFLRTRNKGRARSQTQ